VGILVNYSATRYD
jgi:hypothetical protein